MRLPENCSNKPLANGQTFEGIWRDVSGFSSVTIGLKTDTNATLYIDFSPDAIFTDSTITLDITASLNEVHRITVTRPYVKIRITNDSGSNQTYLRLSTLAGEQSQLTSALNSQIQSDSDTLLVRPLDFNLMVAEGLYQNRTTTLKDGFNDDIRSGTVPEDLWGGGGTYTGFPTGATEEGQIVVAGADTGTVFYSYLLSSDSTDYVFGSKAISGAGNYNLGHNIYRCNYAFFQSANPTAFNAGDITVRWATTTTTIFCIIKTGIGQTFCGAYTVPAESSIFLDRITSNVRGSNNASLDGYFFYRPFGGSPYLRVPFQAQFGTLYFDDVDYLVRIPQKVDIVPRIIFSNSANQSSVSVSYRLLKVKNL